MARIIGVAIEVLGGRLERGIQGGTPDAHPKREQQDDRKETSSRLTHARILAWATAARSSGEPGVARIPGRWGAGHPPSFRIMAAYFPLRWRATMVAPPGIACFSALSQMLAITW